MPEQPEQLDIKDTGNTSPDNVAPIVEVKYE
jgi:hypothetical protein